MIFFGFSRARSAPRNFARRIRSASDSLSSQFTHPTHSLLDSLSAPHARYGTMRFAHRDGARVNACNSTHTSELGGSLNRRTVRLNTAHRIGTCTAFVAVQNSIASLLRRCGNLANALAFNGKGGNRCAPNHIARTA